MICSGVYADKTVSYRLSGRSSHWKIECFDISTLRYNSPILLILIPLAYLLLPFYSILSLFLLCLLSSSSPSPSPSPSFAFILPSYSICSSLNIHVWQRISSSLKSRNSGNEINPTQYLLVAMSIERDPQPVNFGQQDFLVYEDTPDDNTCTETHQQVECPVFLVPLSFKQLLIASPA